MWNCIYCMLIRDNDGPYINLEGTVSPRTCRMLFVGDPKKTGMAATGG